MGQNSKDHILNLPFVIPLVEDEKFVPNGGKVTLQTKFAKKKKKKKKS